jgi:hypothetical protein
VKYVTSILCLLAHSALAQQPAAAPNSKSHELDVTMQIIMDPGTQLPDAVVRRIPLPRRKSAPLQGTEPTAPAAVDKGNKEGAREAIDVGLEVGQSARERSKEATEQRELARRRRAT